MLGHLRISLWICAVGAVALYAFFVVLARISPQEVAGASAAVAALAAMVAIRSARVNSELADPGGDPRIRRALNRQRERRGF